MRINILATNENVEQVRQTAKENLSGRLVELPLLSTPLSETGEEPITHWFCNFKISEEMYNRLTGLQDLSIMDTGNARSFLRKHNLQRMK